MEQDPRPKCHLLDLPPEIKNRIYLFTCKDPGLGTFAFAPAVYRSRLPPPPDSSYRVWQYRGLTQTCVKLGTEYYPLWLQDLRVRIPPELFPTFRSQILRHGPLHASAMIQIEIRELNIAGRYNFDALPWLQLRTSSPSTHFDLVPQQYLEDVRRIGSRVCRYCLDIVYLGNMPSDRSHAECPISYSSRSHEELSCFHRRYREALDCLFPLMPIKELFSSVNESLLEAVRSGHIVGITVSFNHNVTDKVKFKIKRNAWLWQQIDSAETARGLLKQWNDPYLCEQDFSWTFRFSAKVSHQLHGTSSSARYTRTEDFVIDSADEMSEK